MKRKFNHIDDMNNEQIQFLYHQAELIKNEDHRKVDLQYKNRLEELDKAIENINIDKMNHILEDWEKNQFHSTIYDINDRLTKLKYYNYNVLKEYNIPNQFNRIYFYQKTTNLYGANNACITISVLFCYFFSQHFMTKEIVEEVMFKGAELFNVWKKNNKNEDLPTILEILNIKECEPFNKYFNNKFEIGGLFKIADEKFELNQKLIKKPTFKDLIFESLSFFNQTKDKYIYFIFVLKRHYSISIIVSNPLFPKNIISINEKMMYEFDIFLFDSHGTYNIQEEIVDYIKFSNIYSLINYMEDTYSIGTIENELHQENEGKILKNFDFYCKYCYTCFVFYSTKKKLC